MHNYNSKNYYLLLDLAALIQVFDNKNKFTNFKRVTESKKVAR